MGRVMTHCKLKGGALFHVCITSCFSTVQSQIKIKHTHILLVFRGGLSCIPQLKHCKVCVQPLGLFQKNVRVNGFVSPS